MALPDRIAPVWKESRGFYEEFKSFIRRGNVIDLAVGVIMGAAFGKIVSSLVGDLLMPLIGYVTGEVDLKHYSVTMSRDGKPPVTIAYGQFLQSVIDFVIVAFCVFLLVKLVNRLHRPTSEPPKDPSDEVKLLMEIRDLLKDAGGPPVHGPTPVTSPGP